MRICTWNLGLFSWMKHAKRFGIKISNVPVKNEYYTKGNLKKIVKTLQKISPEILIVQEIFNDKDIVELKKSLNYKNHLLIDAWYHKHSIGVLSNENIDVGSVEGEFTVVKIGELKIVPIHLNSFYPSKRLRQVESLIKLAESVDAIIGDTNFWAIRGKYLTKPDRKAYEMLNEKFFDSTAKLPTTYFNISMDKIFLKEKSGEKAKLVEKRGSYMDHKPVYVDL